MINFLARDIYLLIGSACPILHHLTIEKLASKP